jgi:hypothetical protein
MKAAFQLTPDDYVDAQRTHLRKVLGKKTILLFAIPTLALALYAWAFIHWSPQFFLQLKPFGYVALGVVFLIAYFWSGFPFRVQFRKISALHSPYQVEAGPEGMNFTSVIGHTHQLWQGFEDFQESKRNFLLYTQRNLFFIVPKRALQPEEVSSFRELAKSRITAK